MKRIFHTLMLIVGFLMSSLNLHAQLDTVKLFDGIEKEYQIDFSKGFFKSKQSGDSAIYWFGQKVKAGTDKLDVKNSELSIRVSAFDKLYRIAKDKLPKRADGLPTGITGFLMYYGLDKHNKIELFFRPWVMDNLNEKGKKLHGSVRTIDKEIIYTYLKGKNKFVGYQLGSKEFQHYEKSTERYRSIIRIQDKGEKREFEYCDFEAKNWRCDSQNVFFTFRQLKVLYEINFPDDKSKRYSNSILTYEGVILKEFQIHGPRRIFLQKMMTRSRNKITSLFLTDKEVREFKAKKSFKILNKNDSFKYGNLSGICPPGCDSFRYPIIN